MKDTWRHSRCNLKAHHRISNAVVARPADLNESPHAVFRYTLRGRNGSTPGRRGARRRRRRGMMVSMSVQPSPRMPLGMEGGIAVHEKWRDSSRDT